MRGRWTEAKWRDGAAATKERTGLAHFTGNDCHFDTPNVGHVQELLTLMSSWPGSTLLARMAAVREAERQVSR
jgi:hypothetical protein